MLPRICARTSRSDTWMISSRVIPPPTRTLSHNYDQRGHNLRESARIRYMIRSSPSWFEPMQGQRPRYLRDEKNLMHAFRPEILNRHQFALRLSRHDEHKK
jgi:hypothetical protein